MVTKNRVSRLLVPLLLVAHAAAAEPGRDPMALRSFLDTHCVGCHGAKDPEGNVSLHALTVPTKGALDLGLWGRVYEQIEARQMPPVDAEQPATAARLAMVGALGDALKAAGASIDELKALAPSRGNWVDHDVLFSGKAVGDSGTPARAWRLSAGAYMRQFARIDEAYDTGLTRLRGNTGGGAIGPVLSNFGLVSAPWGAARQWNFSDYSSAHRVSGAEIEHHLRNCRIAIKELMPQLLRLQTQPLDRQGPLASVVPLFGAGKAAKPEQVDAAVQGVFTMLFHLPLAPEAVRAHGDRVRQDLEEHGGAVAVERLLIAALCHREAMYRIEEPEAGVRRGLMPPRHLARSIAFTLTDREPDAELWKAADEGRLQSSADVRSQVGRILHDKAIAKPRLLGFFREYFGYGGSADVFKCDATCTEFGVPPVMGSFFHGEQLVPDTDKLVTTVLEADKEVLRTLLTTRKAYICANDVDVYFRDTLPHLARMKEKDRQEAEKKGAPFDENDKKYVRKLEPSGNFFGQMQILYGVTPKAEWKNKPDMFPAPGGPDISKENFAELFGRQEPFDANPDQRMGMLTQPSWLVAMSTNFDNHPIHRGRWVRERLLGGHIPEVPITVNAMLPTEPYHAMRMRMRVTREDYCWNCHRLMDPLGLVFEQFDHFGRFRTLEIVVDKEKDAALVAKDPSRKHRAMTAVPNDTTGEIIDSGEPGLDGPVKGPFELIEKLANSKKVEQVFVRHVFRYFLGRNETLADGPVLVAAHKAYRDGGGSMQALLVSLLSSDAALVRIRDGHAATLSADLSTRERK